MKLLFIVILQFIASICLAQDVMNMDGIDCDMHGSAKPGSRTYDLNSYKNRYQLPASTDFNESATIETMISSADPNQFSQNNATRIKGFVYNVKEGGVEGCNCKARSQEFRDTHIELTPDENHTDPQYRIIAEVTPRIRAIMLTKGVDWSTSSLKNNLKGKLVEIAGWLTYDSEHEDGSYANDPEDQVGRPNWRASCWEIHPVTEIIILDSSADLSMKKLPSKPNAKPSVTYTPDKPVSHEQTVNNIGTQGNDTFPILLAILLILIIFLLIIYVYKSAGK